MNLINPEKYTEASKLLRAFFESKGFIEVPAQSRLSILAACEDPTTVATFNYSGQVWPLPQTGQMWLELELLNNPNYKGVYCQSTSYRQEPNPIEGRHDLIFPMFEFESKGSINELRELENELLNFIGFNKNNIYKYYDYENIAKELGVTELTAVEEERIAKEISNVFFLENFPEYTDPFWNMKRNGETANKIDVLLYGMETIGSAERETDVEIMRHRFHTISNGMYADLLYSHFGKERVEKELEEFLNLNFFPRFGGGIGCTRMIRALNFLNEENNNEIGRT